MPPCFQETTHIKVVYSVYYFAVLLVVAVGDNDSDSIGVLSIAGFACLTTLVFHVCGMSDIAGVCFVLMLAAILFLSLICTLKGMVDVMHLDATLPQLVLIITTVFTGSLRCTELLLQSIVSLGRAHEVDIDEAGDAAGADAGADSTVTAVATTTAVNEETCIA
tara:strand:- start:1954 stop:2445 length:492 start_codon:yes stop_codon:yes gene_type:complete